ncbi:hypothetical protein [Tahibacter amnicola]|uniref:Sporulation related protein n=1 Tax=Tahibacter amnicola TaxID=2976241 RepID=A0ABY6BHT4_9GAMM|nr:hypothetical protein [Tahibacter amnicola]UXI69332.1 hypothetical protein N4264_06695 [Tahibacter amnicola]
MTAAAEAPVPEAAPAATTASTKDAAPARATASDRETPSPAEAGAVVDAPRPAAVAALLRGHSEFARLADSHYVLEVSSGSDRTAVERDAGALALPDGAVYLLRLQRDGNDWFVAAWGDFTSLEAARSARQQAISLGAQRTGWPRRIAPLKQEIRNR